MLRLEAIAFNRDPLSPAEGLNLRRNVTEPVTLPEWRRNVSLDSDDSVAAYAVNELQPGRAITIGARLRMTPPGPGAVDVRAVDPGGDRNVLGTVRARRVVFGPNGFSQLESFELAGVRVRAAGVGIHSVTWRWEAREDAQQPWSAFAETRHRVYTVISLPRLPWQPLPLTLANSQLPWTSVLDYACTWAAGARTLDDAASRITQAVFELGPEIVEYDCRFGGGPQYSFPYHFDCTSFIDLLRGGRGRGRYINCVDCATIVSTFANALGCRLWQSGMASTVPFALNPIVAIGTNGWRTACDWGVFAYHEVAWKGACTAEDAVFDACLLIDGDADPTRAPHQPRLATNLRFGNPGDGDYRDRLAAPLGRVHCQPLSRTRHRRLVA